MRIKTITERREGILRPYSATLVQLNRIVDGLWIAASLWAACRLWGLPWSSSYTVLALSSFIVFFGAAQSNELYRSWRIAPLHDELSRIWRSWAVASFSAVLIVYVFDAELVVSKPVLLLWLVLAPILISVARVAVRLALRAVRKAGRNFRTVAVYGATEMGKRIAERIHHNRWMGLRLFGYFDDRSPGGPRPLAGRPVKLEGNSKQLLHLALAGEIDMVYVALPMRAETRIKQLVNRLADTTTSIYYVPDFSVFDLLHAQWEALGDVPIVSIVDTPFNGMNRVTKRAQDLILASAILLVAALPMLMIALAIKSTSKGPVLFRQQRHGLDGKVFDIWKFRTMSVCEDGTEAVQAMRHDPRVTPVGAFLRRWSFDELPQFFNVLQGRMSIVGPRPHPLTLNEQHRRLIHRYMLRHKVRPGITGWAQVNGCRGGTETLEKMRRRLEYDLEYIHNWSTWLDLRIMVATLFKGSARQNAY